MNKQYAGFSKYEKQNIKFNCDYIFKANKTKIFNRYLHLPRDGNGMPLQYSCMENPMDGGAGRLQSMGSLRVGHD